MEYVRRNSSYRESKPDISNTRSEIRHYRRLAYVINNVQPVLAESPFFLSIFNRIALIV